MASQTGSYDFKAARQAYIKANAAQDAIDNLEIGGRNLLLRSKDYTQFYYSMNGATAVKSAYEDGVKFEITALPVSGSWGVLGFNDGRVKNIIEPSQEYTVSFDLMANIALSGVDVQFNVRDGNSKYPMMNQGEAIFSLTKDTWHHVVITTTALNTLPQISGQHIYFAIGKLKEQLCTFYVRNLKFEKGSVATDWTPAPEDLVEQARLQTPITAAAAMTEGKIVCGTDSGYRDVAAGVSFDLGHSLLYCGKTIASGASSEYNYLSYDGVNASATGTIESGAAKKTLYLKGSISNNSFVISGSPFLTTVIPDAESEYYYIPLGVMYSTTNIYFNSTNRLYTYINGAFQAVDAAGQILALQSINRLNTMEPLVESHSAQLNVMQDNIMSNVEAKYTRADEFNTYVDSQQSSLEQLSNSITAQFSESRELISSVNGALETYKDDISKYIRFSAEGIEIGEEGNALTLKIDNDEIGFYKDGDQIACWDGSTLYTGNAWITLERQFRIGNFAAIPRSDGSVSWLKVGE